MPALLFERQGSTNILVSGSKGRSAARQNVLVRTDHRNDHRRWSADIFEKVSIQADWSVSLTDLFRLFPLSAQKLGFIVKP